jgi:histidinol-phosphate aminotransferase
VTQAVAAAALSPSGLKDMRDKVKKIRFDRNSLGEDLRNMGFYVPDSQANFLLATRAGRPGAEALYKNLKKKHLLVRYFSHSRLKDSLRITVGTPEQNAQLLAALKAIRNS